MAHNDHSHKSKNRRNNQVLPRSTYTVPLIAFPNLNAKSVHRSESRPKESSSQRAFGVGNQRSGFNNDYEVTALDHQIEDHERTTFILDYLPHRLRLTKEKKSKTLKKHIKKLTKEIEYLRQKLTYYKDTRKVLMRFYDSINESHRMIRNALCETFKDVAIFEQRLLNYWEIHHDDDNSVNNVF